MEGYLNLRIQPWLRRLITRLIAIIPAFIVIYLFGEGATGQLLILSQVVLSLQLGFAVIPLIHLTSNKKQMGEFVIKLWMKILAWIVALIIVTLNVKLVVEKLSEWIRASENPTMLYIIVVPLVLAAGVLLLYITFGPLLEKTMQKGIKVPDGAPLDLKISTENNYRRIAIPVDFSSSDSKAISHAISQGGKTAEYILIHIVETAGARLMDSEIDDLETETDRVSLEKYRSELTSKGYTIEVRLGFGNPKNSIPEIVNTSNCDLLVMGAHGHRGLKDIILGTTLEAVRHNISIPLLIVK